MESCPLELDRGKGVAYQERLNDTDFTTCRPQDHTGKYRIPLQDRETKLCHKQEISERDAHKATSIDEMEEGSSWTSGTRGSAGIPLSHGEVVGGERRG